jgi:hypothetical protein
MVTPNSEMARADLVALVNLANLSTPTKLPRGPFALFNPKDDVAAGAPYVDLPAPYTVTDRGAWAAGTYNAGDQVTCEGYLFISVKNLNSARPLDATTHIPTTTDWRMPWQSCYQRIRDEVYRSANTANVLAGGQWLETFRQSVSGPWPCQSPSINYDKLAFYFEDTGHAESVTLTGGLFGNFVGKATLTNTEILWDDSGAHFGNFPTSEDNNSPLTITAHSGPGGWIDSQGGLVGGQSTITYPTSVELQYIVGGTKPVHITGIFQVSIVAYKAWGIRDEGAGAFAITPDTDDPLTLFTKDDSGWMGGTSFTASFSGWSAFYGGGFPAYTGTITLSSTVDAIVYPGTYTLKLDVTRGPNNTAGGSLINSGTWSGYNEWKYNTFVMLTNVMSIDPPSGITRSIENTSVETPGIDDHVRIMKIDVTEFDAGGVPSGLYGQSALFKIKTPTPTPSHLPYLTIGLAFYGGTTIWEFIPDTVASNVPTFVKYITNEVMKFDTITASTTGYWLGKTPPVQSLGMMPDEQMPWNQFPTTFPVSGANTATDNKYLGFTLPYVSGRNFDGNSSLRAYDSTDAPGWLTASNAGELLPWPKVWKPLVHYPIGWTIIDSNGNLQTAQSQGRSFSAPPAWGRRLGDITAEPSYLDISSHSQPGVRWALTNQLTELTTIQRSTAYASGVVLVDTNGYEQKCAVGGVTSGAAPAFSTALGGFTSDGSVTWQVVRVNTKFAPPVARISPPIYPSFWQNPGTQWRPNTNYAPPTIITDSNGNSQQAQAAGQSGGAQPGWSTVLNGFTNDGTTQWRCIRLEQPSLVDPNVNSLGKHPFSFAPQGWWLYRIFLNRIPQSQSTDKPPSTPIAVTLGCVRSGVFVAFGTYMTGTPVDAMWPVFTNTALAYQCAERIDVQAEILTCGLSYSVWGSVSYPLAATHLNDITTIIGRI